MLKRTVKIVITAMIIMIMSGCSSSGNTGREVPDEGQSATVTATPTQASMMTSVPVFTPAVDPEPTEAPATPTPSPAPTPTSIPDPGITAVSGEQTEALEINRLADELLGEIITPRMDDWDKIFTLWSWCRNNISYVNDDGDMADEIHGAYEGLHDRKGNSCTYYATFKILLDKTGIQNQKCLNENDSSGHYWNLVNYNGRWYHCDTCPPADDGTFYVFLQTDVQLRSFMHYTKNMPDRYSFGTDAYPERSDVPVYDGWSHRKLKFNVEISRATFDERIKMLKKLYPDGKYWNGDNLGVTESPCHNNHRYDRCNFYYSTTSLLFPKSDFGWQCAGFASMLSDYCFGKDTAAYNVYDYDEVRVGDQFRFTGSEFSHSAFIIEKTDEYVVVAECNADCETCRINWGRKITREELEKKKAWYISRSCVIK